MSPHTGVLTVGMLSLGLLSVLPVAGAESIAPKTVSSSSKVELPQQIQAAIDKGDYTAAQTALIAELKNLKSITPENKQALNMSMMLEVIRETSPEIMTDFASSSKAKRQFLATFMQDPAWQELYLTCGLVPHQTETGIKVLYDIWKKEKGQVKNKPLAVALASVWGGGETAPNPRIASKNPARYNPVWRYEFFQKQAAKGMLHPNYKNLKCWELRFTVGIPAQDWDDGSFSWLAEHVNLPWDQYQQACWAATYTDPSRFGDSVQGGAYNLPYSDISWGEATQRSGGVCGALSHLGCVAAMAHGIPAYTVGQPGHCAYAVRPERGKWIGGFGGPDGGMHNHIFGNQAPTSYLLMETVFGDDTQVTEAYRQSFCARALEAIGNTADAREAWEKALKSSPVHPFFRKQLHRLMLEDGLTAQGAYDYLMSTIPLYKGNGFSSINMAKDFDNLLQGLTDEQREAIYAKEHEMIATTPSTWAVKSTDTTQAQCNTLTSDDAKLKFLTDIFTIHMHQGDGTTFGQMLEWAVTEFVKQGREDLFSRAFAKAAEAAPVLDKTDTNKSRKMTEAYNKAIFAAEQARSAPAFKALSAAALKACGAEKSKYTLKQPGNIKGKLAPAVLFRISHTSNFDAPARHQFITTPEGGACHTSRETKSDCIVELEKTKYVTGCVIRKTDGNEHRMKKATIYTSEDGATWKPRADVDKMPKEWAVSFPANTRAKWVKIEFNNDSTPDFAHISHFLIYAK